MKTLGRWDAKNSMWNHSHPLERETCSPLVGEDRALGHRMHSETNECPAATATATQEISNDVAMPSLSLGERAGVSASVTSLQLRLLAFGLCFLAVASLHAQDFAIDWHTIDGGGGTSGGGNFSLSGTIGQPDASAQPMTGGNFSLTGGFWSLFAVQTPDAPLLAIRLTSGNLAVVSWPAPSTGFALQQNSDLNTTNWVAVPQAVSDNGTNKFVTISPPAGRRFYRLIKP